MLIALGLGASAVIALLVSLALSEGGPTGERVDLVGRRQSVALLGGLRQDGPLLGEPGAPVRVSYFTDVQCQPCGEYHERVIPTLIRRLVRDGRASIELRHFSTSARERTVGAIASVAAAEQRREWQFADLFLRNQRRVPRSGIDQGYLRNVARASGLDVRSWEDRQQADEVEARLDDDAREARDRRLPAKPAILVEGPGGFRELDSSPSASRVFRAVRELQAP